MTHIAPVLEKTQSPGLVAVDGRTYPLKSARLTARAEAGLAQSTLAQRFGNPYPEALEVVYSLAVPADGAVTGYRIRIGDTVSVGNVNGTVTRIRIRATTITDWDRKELIIPNKEFVTGQVVNWTLSDATLRIVANVGIAYGSDTDQAERLLQQIAAEHPLVLDDPATNIFVMNLGDSSVDFACRPWVKSADYWTVYGDLTEQAKVELEAAGCSIPYPQRDMHVYEKNDD